MTEVTETRASYLTGQQVNDLMGMLRDIDSVELKTTIPMTDQQATIKGLPLDPVETEPRQVFFFDTPDLALSKAGVAVRARRIRGGHGDTVVKLRPVVPADLPDDVRRSGSFKVEIDIAPGGFVCSGSMKGKASGDEVRDVAAGTQRLSKILTKEQRAFYRANAPSGIPLDSLAVLGPSFALKGVFTPKSLNRKVVLELWIYPDGSHLLELSTKCAPLEGPMVGAQFRAYLAKRGTEMSGNQQAKTRTALEFYAARLQAQADKQPRRAAELGR
jgi:hypothetical protein